MSDLLAQQLNEFEKQEHLDLNASVNRKYLAQQIKDDIDAYCINTYDGGHRTHLGASIIGNDCLRYAYNTFRHVKHTVFSGRMQRLFNRGHREEARFIEWLRGIGFQVWDADENGNQFRVSAVNGHFGGSLDGVNQAPAKYRIKEPMLCEFKTNGTGAGFNKLVEKGVRVAKPVHFVQMSIYGKERGFNYALYMCINKNDDDLYIEIVELDHFLAEQKIKDASEVINANVPPPKLGLSPAHFACKMCDFKSICHEGEPVERNCRTCQFSAPIEDAQWYCKQHGGSIPKDFISKTCDSYTAIQC